MYETTKDMTEKTTMDGDTTEKTMEDARTESTTRECETPEEDTAEKMCDRCLQWYHSTCTTAHRSQCMG